MKKFRVKGIDLADYIHVDNSLISKWRTGKRQLNPESEVLNAIIEYFITLDSSTGFQNLRSILQTAYPDTDLNKMSNIKILLKRWLTEKEPENYFISKQINNKNVKLLQNVLYYGHDGRKRAAMDIVDLLLESDQKEEIMILDFDHSTWKYKDAEFHNRWYKKYEQIITRGHKVVLVHSPYRTYEERLNELTDWLGFYIRGNVHVYINNHDIGDVFKPSLIVLKGKAALFGVSAQGFTPKMNVQITSDKLMVDHYAQIFEAAKSLCTPMHQKIDLKDLNSLLEKCLSLEKKSGDMIIKDKVPYCMLLPRNLFYKILKDNKVDEKRIKILLSFSEEYSQAFFRNVQYFKYKILLDESHLENLFMEQDEIDYDFLSMLAGKPIKVSKEFCCYHLDYLIRLMKRYKNLEISFSSYGESDQFNNIGMFIKQYKALIAYGKELKSIYSKEAAIIDTLFTYYYQLLMFTSRYDKDREIVEEKIKKLIRLHISSFETPRLIL